MCVCVCVCACVCVNLRVCVCARVCERGREREKEFVLIDSKSSVTTYYPCVFLGGSWDLEFSLHQARNSTRSCLSVYSLSAQPPRPFIRSGTKFSAVVHNRRLILSPERRFRSRRHMRCLRRSRHVPAAPGWRRGKAGTYKKGEWSFFTALESS